MKISLAILLAVVSSFASANAATSSVTRLLPNISDRVAQCSVLPFSLNQDEKTYHAIYSHCPEVKITSPGTAKIKVASHIFQAVLVESADSDGDFYDVVIQDTRTGETETLANVPAYGDILLGVLGGNTTRVVEQEIADDAATNDMNLVRARF